MKKIPSLEELRRPATADPSGKAPPDPAPDAPSVQPAGVRSGSSALEGDGPAVPSEIESLADLPDDVLAHAVRLGDGESGVRSTGRAAELAPGLATGQPAASTEPVRDARPPKRKAGSRLAVRRRYSRERAAQALYAWDIGDASATEVLRYFLDHQDMSRADVDWFREAFTGVAHDPAPVDALIEPVIDRGFDELDPVERAILRLGCWELMTRRETPVRVTINEGVEVAKRFGAEQGHRFVNGVLDAIARDIRADEIGAGDRSRRPA